jgi:putative NADH-flavin reductase
MNDPHKFSKEFGSDHALEQRTAIVSHHDTIKWFEAIPAELKPGQRTGKFRLGNDQLLVDPKRPEQVFRSGLRRRDD